MIISTAYGIPFQSPRLQGLPAWAASVDGRFDIEAVASTDKVPVALSSQARIDLLRAMLRALLEDRFRLSMKVESKEQPVYALTVAKGGTRLKPSSMNEDACINAPAGPGGRCHSLGGGQGRGLHGVGVDAADVVLFIQNWTDRPVVDKTGLTSLFDIDTEGWIPMRQAMIDPANPRKPEGTPDDERPTLMNVLAKLGLNLESQRAAVDIYVVQRLERPSAN